LATLDESAHARLAEARQAGVTRVRVHYSDLLGTTRAKVVPVDVVEEAAEDGGLSFCLAVFAIDHTGVMPDGTGLRDEVNFRDMQVVPDLATLRRVPWEKDTAICMADCLLDGEPFPAAPRQILRRAVAEAKSQGLDLRCGHELEFFLFRRENGRYVPYAETPGLVYRLDPRVDPDRVLRHMEDAVRDLELPFVCANQEYDPSQWEINTRYAPALEAADDAHLLKLAVKEIAALHGLTATFMGRPVNGGGTSGYHLHISSWKNGRNEFADARGRLGLSPTARRFVGGLLEHACGTSAIVAPTINAYKRFAAQELGPYWVDWGRDNRSVYVRIPNEAGSATRIEFRGGDGSASPYLAAAAAIFAGVDGVARRLDPGPPTDAIYQPPGDRPRVPLSLAEALDELDADAYIREKFGDEFLQAFSTLKRTEVRRYTAYAALEPRRTREDPTFVTEWELREYAEAL
jgi:glutamine synthetase